MMRISLLLFGLTLGPTGTPHFWIHASGRQLASASLLVEASRVNLALPDPQVARKLGVVATNLLDEALRVLVPERS
jgi:hypothetical protein